MVARQTARLTIPGMELWLLGALFVLAVAVGAVNAAIGPTGGAMIGGVSLLVPPPLSITLHAATSAYSSLLRAVTLRRHIDWALVRSLTAWSLPALIAASAVALQLPTRAWVAGLGAFLVAWAVSERLRDLVAALRRIGPVAALASVSAVWVGTGSMIVMPFVLARTGTKERAIATEASYVAIQHLVKLALLAPALAVSLHELLWPAAVLLTGSTLGNFAGSRMLLRMSDRTHARLLRTVLALVGVALVVSAAVAGGA